MWYPARSPRRPARRARADYRTAANQLADAYGWVRGRNFRQRPATGTRHISGSRECTVLVK